MNTNNFVASLKDCFRIEMYRMFTVQAYQTSQYVAPRGGIFLG
jgi:hypothetical protein